MKAQCRGPARSATRILRITKAATFRGSCAGLPSAPPRTIGPGAPGTSRPGPRDRGCAGSPAPMFFRFLKVDANPVRIELNLARCPLGRMMFDRRLSGRKVMRSWRRAATVVARNAQASSATSAPKNGITGHAPCAIKVNPNATFTSATRATMSSSTAGLNGGLAEAWRRARLCRSQS